MRQQIDCVVISDHINEARISVLKAELANMPWDSSSGELADFRPLNLFRGEHTSTGNIHILAVLHTRSTSAEEERLLAVQYNYPISRETSDYLLVLQLGPAGIINNIRGNPDRLLHSTGLPNPDMSS